MKIATATVCRAGVLLLAGATLLGCKGGGDEKEGALSNGTFEYYCTGPGDRECHDVTSYPAQSDYEIPSRIATGAPFGLRFVPYEGAASLQLVASDLATATDPDAAGMLTITGSREGYASVIAMAGDTAVDVNTVELREPDNLEVVVYADGDDLITAQGAAGATLNVSFNTPPTHLAATLTHGDSYLSLGGDRPVAWTSSDETVVSFPGATDAARVPIDVASGTATVTVTYAGMTATLEMTIP